MKLYLKNESLIVIMQAARDLIVLRAKLTLGSITGASAWQ